MDRSLDEIISERPSARGGRGRGRPDSRRAPPPRQPRREEYPRDGVRKYRRDDRTDLDNDWVHDRFEDERTERDRHRARPEGFDRPERNGRAHDDGPKLRVDNIHYELNEDDLRGLFEEIGPVNSVRLLYDRLDRSQGTAFVVYEDVRDARAAISQYDGCNANGQPIRLTMVPAAPAASSRGGALLDRAEPKPRSLLDRVTGSAPGARDDGLPPRNRRYRSDSPRRSAAADGGIDRYIPRGSAAERSPIRRRGTPREPGRRPGQRRDEGGRGGARRGRTDDEGRPMVGGRPRKTAEELDAEMEDYFGKAEDGAPKANGAATGANGAATTAAGAATAPVAVATDDDIDMVE